MIGIQFDIINHNFMLEYVDSGLYFVQDKNYFKSVVTGRIRVRILIPDGEHGRVSDSHPNSCHGYTVCPRSLAVNGLRV